MGDISEDIIKRAAAGDMEAFEQIYRGFSGLVYNTAFRITGNREDAREVTQDVFMTVYQKLNSFRFRSSLKTWIYRVAVNLSINRVRKMSRESGRSVEFDDGLDYQASAHGVQPQVLHTTQEDAQTLLNVLNEDQRACITLRSIQGLSYEEIAETLKININTVRSRIKRAREKLMVFQKEVAKNEL